MTRPHGSFLTGRDVDPEDFEHAHRRADFDDSTIGISHVAPQLNAAIVEWLGQELCAAATGSFTEEQVFLDLDEVDASGLYWATAFEGCAESTEGQGTCE